MIFYIAVCLVSISVLILTCVLIISSKDNRVFRGEGFTETLFIRTLVDNVLPARGSRADLTWDNTIFMFDKNRSIRDLYFAKVCSLFAFIFIASAIISTNAFVSYKDTFVPDSKVPVFIGKDNLKILSTNLTYYDNARESELVVLKDNISLIHSTEDKDRFKTMSIESLYEYTEVLNARLNGLLGMSDLFIFLAICFVGWKLPTILLNLLFSIIDSKSLMEYSSLETLIYMEAYKQVYDIIPLLLNESTYFRELLRGFQELYEEHGDLAYTIVAERREFPQRFKSLIRYLSLIEGRGAESAKDIILASKITGDEELFLALQADTNKKKRRIMNQSLVVSILCMLGLLSSLL